jgi:hypothetical protein
VHLPRQIADVSEEFQLRSIAVAAYGPATLFGLAEGSMMPVIILSGSGIVMTLGADISPAIGRPTFLGIWRELADAGSGIGPVILSAVTAVAGLGPGIIVSGIVGFAAAAALWVWTPKHPGASHGPQAAGAADTLARLTDADAG